MDTTFTIEHALPTPEAFKALRDSAGWGDISSFSFITRPDKDYGAGMFAKLQNLKDGTTS